MSWKPITLNGISFLSQDKEPALIEFKRGLNVICGATDSGKSFILETIDFMLASSYPTKLKDFAERDPYDRVRLIIETIDDQLTFERPTSTNSNFSVYLGKYFTDLLDAPAFNLYPNPRPGYKSVSELLLSKIGLSEKFILTKKDGETKSLGFRQLVPFILINEEKIIKSVSNILGDQFIHYTRDYSTFKLLLTGFDDSALKAVEIANKQDTISTKGNHLEKSAFIDELIIEIDMSLQNDGRTLAQLEN